MEERLLNLPQKPKWWNKQFTILFVVILSIVLHAWSVWQLPEDFDEPVYLNAASDYSNFILNGDLVGLINYEGNQEHPALVKILYSIPYLLFEKKSDSSFYFYAARGISAFFGVLTVYIVALMNPWAGFLFALHSMTLKYTSQAYLEAVPLFAMVFSVYALLKSQKEGKGWFYLSAISLGVIAASKYPYVFIIIILGFIWFQFSQKNKLDLIKFVMIAVVTFIILNPSLWLEPVNRLISSIGFHPEYSQSFRVQSYAYPWFQPLIFISTSVQWHPQVFFFFSTDEIVFYLTIFGLWFEIKDKSYTAVWFILGLSILMIWPTKWPQYTLLLSPVLAIIAGKTIDRAWGWIKPRNDYWNYLDEMLPKPPKITWWIIGVFLVVLFVGKVNYEFQLALARRGWNHYDTNNSPLIGNVVNQINHGKENEILIATNKGFVVWERDSLTLWGKSSKFYDPSNSPLPSERITAVEYDDTKGIYWLGTINGVVSFDGENWIIFKQESLKCQLCQVNDIFIDQTSTIWVGMNDGIYFFDGAEWSKLVDHKNDMMNTSINTMVKQESSDNNKLWVGSYSGVSAFNFSTNQWEHFVWEDNFFGWGGVVDLYILADQRIVASTSGGGIGIFQEDWTFLKNSNSPFQSNTVNSAVQAKDGSIWFGFGYSTEPGGYLMRLDPEKNWQRYGANTSGYLGNEPISLFLDHDERLWVGTNGNGIQTYFREKE